ncbi:BrnT family toxin [Tardiphaga alba]|uniref:BrnT family toxin n=1 Tax=Tardiphaga alba TaxID=340268 RepID=A0ABX8ABP4_9BRAD|nr:BrnT family toxin [Tardiphaga alba]
MFFGGTFNCVKITYDPAKCQTAVEERGIHFADAAIVFEGPSINLEDRRRDYGERRFQTIGFLAGRMVMVVWTPRGEARHVMSMRKCNAREKAIYQKRFDEA